MSFYSKTGYALVQDDQSTEDHWIGGSAYHKNAICPVCQIPLLLLVDLNYKIISKNGNLPLVSNFDRLPLYYCWRCSARSLGYRVISLNEIEVLQNEGRRQPDDFPYSGFPIEFERRPLKLIPITYNISKLLFIAQEIGIDWLDENDNECIYQHLKKYRHSGFLENYLNRHQVGGVLNQFNGHNEVGCPYENCFRHTMFSEGASFYMQELAVIHNDPFSGLPMVGKEPNDFNEWVQVVYWICEECFTLIATNKTD